jgi:hypothetical protein
LDEHGDDGAFVEADRERESTSMRGQLGRHETDGCFSHPACCPERSTHRTCLPDGRSGHRLKAVRGRRAPACQGGEKSTEQAGPVSHNPNSTDFDDKT